MLTTIAGLLVGVWLIMVSQTTVSRTLTLVVGIAVAVLTLVDLVRPYTRSA